MIEHVWTVACVRAIIDKTSNNVSIFEALERLTLTGGPGTEGIAPIAMDVISYWSRSNLAQPSRGNARLRLLAPGGSQIGDPALYEVNLEEFPRARNIIRFGGFPFRGSGIHAFVIELEHEGTWSTVARVPLEVVLQIAEAPTSTGPTV